MQNEWTIKKECLSWSRKGCLSIWSTLSSCFFFFSLPFSSLSLGKEARKKKIKKVRKEIWNIYLAFPVLCVMFVIIMGREWWIDYSVSVDFVILEYTVQTIKKTRTEIWIWVKTKQKNPFMYLLAWFIVLLLSVGLFYWLYVSSLECMNYRSICK